MNIKIFQICYSEETLAKLPEGFFALDNIENLRPDWREYWPIRNFLMDNHLSDDVLYGFLSPKFGEKTLLDYASIRKFIDLNYKNEDVVCFSPFWDLVSVFKNIFEQGDFFHPGLTVACQDFCNKYVAGLDVTNSVTHSENTIFCNYFLAKKSFWREWLELGEKLFHCAENSSSDLAIKLNSVTTYGSSELPMKIFVQERMATMTLLSNSNLSCLSHSPFSTGSSTTIFNKFHTESVLSDSLKMSFMKTKNPIYFNQFSIIRDKIISMI